MCAQANVSGQECSTHVKPHEATNISLWERHRRPIKSHDSSVDIALDYRGSRVRFPARAGNFFLHHRIQKSSGVHPASYPMCMGSSFPAVKRPGREADHSPQLVPRSKYEWSYTSTPQYVFMAWCSAKVRGQLYFYLKGTLRPLKLWKHGFESRAGMDFVQYFVFCDSNGHTITWSPIRVGLPSNCMIQVLPWTVDSSLCDQQIPCSC